MILWLYGAHSGAPASVGAGVAKENGQCGLANSSTRHRRRFATTSIAARQWAAWESPRMTTVSPPPTPTAHASSPGKGVQATFGVIAACSGVGVTVRASFL